MNKPLEVRNKQALANDFGLHKASVSVPKDPHSGATARGWRSLQYGALAIAAASTLLAIAQVSLETLDAAAVMALTRVSSGDVVIRSMHVAVDPHDTGSTPFGLELIGSRTPRLGSLASVDEYDYRNADGEPITLLTSPAPLASDAPHWRERRVGDIRLLSWTLDGKRYVLAGHANTRGLMRAADALTMP